MPKAPKDPIEGFQITGYDPETQKLTIEIHPTILKHQGQQAAIAIKAVEIIEGGPSVNAIEFVPREQD